MKIGLVGLFTHTLWVVGRAEHTVAITPDDVITWGSNSMGQCGQGDRAETDWVKPRSIKPLQSMFVCQIVCGRYHTLCVTATSQARTSLLWQQNNATAPPL